MEFNLGTTAENWIVRMAVRRIAGIGEDDGTCRTLVCKWKRKRLSGA